MKHGPIPPWKGGREGLEGIGSNTKPFRHAANTTTPKSTLQHLSVLSEGAGGDVTTTGATET